MGTDDPVQDVALQRVTVSQTAFEDAPVTLQAEVGATGYSGEPLVAQLVKLGHTPGLPSSNSAAASASNAPARPRTTAPAGAARIAPPADKVVSEQRQRASGGTDPAAFRFQFKPEQAGLSFYKLQVAPKEGLDRLTNAALSTEATLANNSRVVVVDRGRGPYRILYVSGRPNWSTNSSSARWSRTTRCNSWR